MTTSHGPHEIPKGHTTQLRQPGFDACSLRITDRAASGQDHPSSAVEEFTLRVEVACMTGRLGDHMQQDVPQSVRVRLTEEVVGPPGNGSVRSGCADDGVREGALRAVPVKDVGSLNV